MARSQIDVLLNLVPDNPAAVLQHLTQNPTLASQQDFSGYSLLHAAASYSHPDLIKALITEYHVDINLRDEDGETALFVTENEDVAAVLIGLEIDTKIRNAEGMTAAEKIDGEGDWPVLAEYLRKQEGSNTNGQSASTNGASVSDEADSRLSHPPPLPSDDIKIEFGTMTEEEAGEAGEAPDPEFKRRIEALAARDDFQTEEGQRELRELITDAVLGLRENMGEKSTSGADAGDRSRRRIE